MDLPYDINLLSLSKVAVTFAKPCADQVFVRSTSSIVLPELSLKPNELIQPN